MKKKIKTKKVNDFCSVSKFHSWNVNLGDAFNEGDVIYTMYNLNEKYEVKADCSGVLTDKYVSENYIVEDYQVIGEYMVDSESEYDPVGVGIVYKIVNKIKERNNKEL